MESIIELIYKTDDETNCNNYWCVSLLSHAYKTYPTSSVKINFVYRLSCWRSSLLILT